ncbi:hypothetical protein ZIOFF_066568 [Zingiber officinale]|uniref:Uncharacterized protein n=1 Tax=Zingiber officinale TaxID=94328 RepID=A0A8J5K9A5_ZINOF|nr:hypothetical protein ZIOFF_066568 [Zingiber officinale]
MATTRKPFVLLQQLIKTYPIFDPSTSALVLRHLVDYQRLIPRSSPGSPLPPPHAPPRPHPSSRHLQPPPPRASSLMLTSSTPPPHSSAKLGPRCLTMNTV